MTLNNICKILIAEDSPTQAEELKYILEKHGHTVTTTVNGNAALKQAHKHKPDLIISDIIMPEMDGFGLTKAIKTEDNLKDIPVIILTTLANLHDVIKGLECGADSFIRKPYDEEYLLSRIEYLLENRRLHKDKNVKSGLEVHIDGQQYTITSERQQILDLLISTYEQAVCMNRELIIMNNNLEQARKDAEAANKSKSQFLANMSHELRTPLNAIIGYSEMLAEDARETGDKQTLSDLNKIRSAGQHLLGLINDILDLSKIESGRMDLYAENFSIKDLVEEVVDTVLPMAEKNGNMMKIDCSDGIGEMYNDKTKVRQILTNLLSNAVKFTSGGSIEMVVECNAEDKTLFFAVKDTGIGMTEDQLERIFEVFTQADTSISRDFGGTGLGLTISRKMADLMGGEISAESTYGKGTVFTLKLPVSLLESDSYMKKVSGRHKNTESSQDDNAKEMPVSLRHNPDNIVLLIDDDEQSRELLGIHLERDGWQIISATNGPDGISLAREYIPRVIVLDIVMLGMDGWDVLETLKGDRELRHIPVVICSTLDESNRAYDLGAEAYIIKPIDRQKLINSLNRHKVRPDSS